MGRSVLAQPHVVAQHRDSHGCFDNLRGALAQWIIAIHRPDSHGHPNSHYLLTQRAGIFIELPSLVMTVARRYTCPDLQYFLS